MVGSPLEGDRRQFRQLVRGDQPCACRKLYPRSSGGMLVFVEDAAEALVSSYVQTGDLVRISDRRGQRMQRAGTPLPGDPQVSSIAPRWPLRHGN
jgi:hypothetical protein